MVRLPPFVRLLVVGSLFGCEPFKSAIETDGKPDVKPTPEISDAGGTSTDSSGADAPPELTFVAPRGDDDSALETATFNVTFGAADAESTAVVSLYRSTGTAGCLDGTLVGWSDLARTLAEGVDTSFAWSLDGLAGTTQYLCGKIDDGKNPPVYALSGSLAVNAVVALTEFSLTEAPHFKKSGTSVALAWTPSNGATSYDVVVAADAGCATAVETIGDVVATSTTVSGLADGTYYLCVKAFNATTGQSRGAATDGFRLTMTPGIALGQPSVTANAPGGGPTGENAPLGSWTDGVRLAVADTGNNRVLIWLAIPTASHQAPDLVLGQPDLNTVTPNTGGVSNQSLRGPITVQFDGTHFVVAEYDNNRVLIWNSFPHVDRQPADVVVGQSTMSTAAFGTTATTLRAPSSAFSDGERLYVTDDSNNRVLIYSPFPTGSGAAATVALGQGGAFTTRTWDGANATRTSIDDPSSVWVAGGKMIVADSGNDRVLIWNAVPTSATPPDLVLGQPDFTSTAANNGGPSAASLYYPTGVSVTEGRLYVGDRSNNRVLIWDAIPAASFAAADRVLGQPDFATVTANTGGVSASSLSEAQFAIAASDFVLVSEMSGHRTLLIPTR